MISKKYESLLFSFIMALIMTGLMSLIITWFNLGWSSHFIHQWLRAYWRAFLIAFPIVLLILPSVKRFVHSLIAHEEKRA